MAFSPSRARRALISLLSTTILAGGLVALAGSPASAAEVAYNVVDRNPTTGVTADSLPTTQIDGVVWDQAIVGDTVYAGGQFANARPAGAAAGTSLSPRSNLLSYNIRTGVLNPGFAPTVNGRIRAMAVSPDKSRLYIVGAFTTVNGQPRSRVAAFNTADGSLVSGFAPVASSDVFSIAVSDSAVYLGGWFGAVNGVARQRLAAVNPSNGATLAWAPTADSTVNTMTLTPDKSRLIVGGIFANLNASPAIGLGSLDASTGTLYPFAANQTIQNYGNSAGIYSLKADATNVYGAAYWFGGTGNFEGMFVADPMSGAIKSMADCHGDTYDVSPVNGVAYTVSHHHDCSNMNGFPDTNPRNRWMRANAFTIDATTTTGPNTMGGYYSFQGQPSSSIINWFPDVSVGSFTGQSQGGWTTEATSEYVVQGGEFPLVNNLGQQGLARFAVPALATSKQGPRASAADSAPTLRGISGTSVRVSWKSNFDRDDQKLTYRLFRTDRTATPLVTQTAASQFWNRPTRIFTDTGLSTDTAYGYYVTATDATGNTLRSATTSITTGSTVVDDSAYSQAVQNDGAAHYWRLNEKAGETTSVDWAGGNDLVLGAGVANGAAGAVNGSADTAATFNGTASGTAGQSSAEPGSNTFTAEAWFKTTTTSGGKIVSFGDSQLGSSGSYDRHVYMGNDGRLNFGVYPGGVRLVTTPEAYNDGQWHQVAASLSSSGMQLYVDGLLQGADGGTTSGQAYSGYWRVGGDNIGGWPNQPASSSFAGTVDDVAIYPTALSVTQLRDHYTKSGRTVDVPAVPADAYGKQVYNDNPLFYWRLNETAGATVADSSQSRVPGNVFGGVSLAAASDVAPGTAAAFDGATGTLSTSKTFTNPTAYSEELWFKTTTTDGGKLIGFGDQPSGRSGNYDRHVYMENSGQLTFGVWTGQANVITSSTPYNDGTWHHLVASQDATNGMKLYVDGALVGSNAQTSNQAYTGYWRVGGDTSWGGNSAFLNGTLDEAAVYPYALTQTQVRSHYNASGAAANAAPVASFTSSCDGATCFVNGAASSDADGSVAGYAWDFGDDGTATGATATHSYAASGTYPVTLTVTDDKGKTATTTQPVTVTVPAANGLPKAAFTSSCVELGCLFDASSSADADGTITSYAWRFGDGDTSAEAKPSHSYAANGTYPVSLTVTDNRGSSDTVTDTVSVSKANAAPTAAFGSSTADLKVSVDGSASADADGTVASYAWDFGDGGTGSGVTASRTYAAAGTYSVKLTVTDNAGATDTVTKPVTVVAAAPPAAGTVVVQDGFGRTGSRWGTADTGGAWTDSGATFFSTTGGKGLITLSRAGSGPTASVNTVSALDSTTTADFSADKVATGSGSQLVLSSRKQGTSEYRLKARLLANGTVRLNTTVVVSGTETSLSDVPVTGLTYAPGDVLKLRFDVSGTAPTTLAGKVWKAAATEPAAAQTRVTNTAAGLQSAGAAAVQGYLFASATNAPVVVSVDNYLVTRLGTTPEPANAKPTAAFGSSTAALKVSVDGSASADADGTVASYAWDFGDGGTGSGVTASRTYAAAGTYSVKLTVTDNAGATDTVTKPVTVVAAAPPAAGTVVVQDGFGRTGSRWGTADTGGAWTDSGATFFSTTGGKGVLTLTKVASGPTASLNAVSVLNSTTTADFSVDKAATGTGTYVTLSARKQGTSEYRLKARLMADGSVRLNTTVVVGGAETLLRESVVPGLTYVAGDVLKLRFDVSGTGTATLAGKVWKASAAEPASAQVSSTNTAAGLQSAGAVAVQGYLTSSSTSAPVAISFDNLIVTRN